MKQTPKLNFEFQPFRIEKMGFLGSKSRRGKSENRQVLLVGLRVGGPAQPPARRSDLENFIFLVYSPSIQVFGFGKEYYRVLRKYEHSGEFSSLF